MAKILHLIVIDPQNSFCSVVEPAQQQLLHSGAFCVPGALDDMRRVAALIDRLGTNIDDIHVTLDSHHALDISSPSWFRDANGIPPEPFTFMREENGLIIGSRMDHGGSAFDIGVFKCLQPGMQRRTLSYLKALYKGGRYSHCIWPPHCLIGTPGHNVVPELMRALLDWTELQGDAIVDFVTKGGNPFVEHFSAITAEVVDPIDPGTQSNTFFIESLRATDEVLIAGEAGSHCLANSITDIANALPDSEFIRKLVLLVDGTSPIAGFEEFQDRFIADLKSRGMRTTSTLEYLE